MHHWRDVGAAALVTLVSAGCAAGEPVAGFYAGKQVTMIVPSGVGELKFKRRSKSTPTWGIR